VLEAGAGLGKRNAPDPALRPLLRDGKSALYFEQMKSRPRAITPTQLRPVTPDAEEKARLVLVGTVGVTDSLKLALAIQGCATHERDAIYAF
jgi:hypothetical protein